MKPKTKPGYMIVTDFRNGKEETCPRCGGKLVSDEPKEVARYIKCDKCDFTIIVD